MVAGFVVTMLAKAFAEEVVDEDAGLREAVVASSNFEVDPSVAHVRHEVVFVDEFWGGVGELGADILGAVEGSAEVKSLEVKGAVTGVPAGEKAVDDEFDEF